MIKKTGLTLLVIFLFSQLPLFAASENVLVGMKDKVVSGVVDTVTGIVELPVQIHKGYRKGCAPIKNKFLSKTVGTILGFFRGVGHAAGRTGYGIFEVATFYTANPENNKGVGVPLDAEYAWEEGEQHSFLKPNLKEGCLPVGRKLVRGLANGFLGVLDLPGQIVKGFRDEQFLLGIIRGVWFSYSRTTSGIGEAILFLVPNPVETQGYSYGSNMPWGGFESDLDS